MCSYLTVFLTLCAEDDKKELCDLSCVRTVERKTRGNRDRVRVRGGNERLRLRTLEMRIEEAESPKILFIIGIRVVCLLKREIMLLVRR